ncbi:single-stranded DNA-binding protein [Lentisphaerota bacterium WC36G]|nr:single-stranded DNA-binding protein [Lentisphaerae bacterium WC36]
MNCVIMTGYIATDLETNQVGNSSVTEFTIAVNEQYGKKKETYWGRCVAWGALSNFASSYLHKGSLVEAKGRLQQNNYEKNGVKHSKTRIVLETIKGLNAGGNTNNNQQQSNTQTTNNTQQQNNYNGNKYGNDLPPSNPDVFNSKDYEDDIPF